MQVGCIWMLYGLTQTPIDGGVSLSALWKDPELCWMCKPAGWKQKLEKLFVSSENSLLSFYSNTKRRHWGIQKAAARVNKLLNKGHILSCALGSMSTGILCRYFPRSEWPQLILNCCSTRFTVCFIADVHWSATLNAFNDLFVDRDCFVLVTLNLIWEEWRVWGEINWMRVGDADCWKSFEFLLFGCSTALFLLTVHSLSIQNLKNPHKQQQHVNYFLWCVTSDINVQMYLLG